MSLRKQFATNIDKEIEGIEVEITESENDDGSFPTFVLASMGGGNKRYNKALEAATRPYRRQGQLIGINEDKAEEIFKTVFVDTVLKGWRNVPKSDVTGNETDAGYAEFNKQNALSLLRDEMRGLYERLQEEAKLSANFRDFALESEAKN